MTHPTPIRPVRDRRNWMVDFSILGGVIALLLGFARAGLFYGASTLLAFLILGCVGGAACGWMLHALTLRHAERSLLQVLIRATLTAGIVAGVFGAVGGVMTGAQFFDAWFGHFPTWYLCQYQGHFLDPAVSGIGVALVGGATVALQYGTYLQALTRDDRRRRFWLVLSGAGICLCAFSAWMTLRVFLTMGMAAEDHPLWTISHGFYAFGIY